MELPPQKKKYVLPFFSSLDNQTHTIILDSNYDSGNQGVAFFESKEDQRVFLFCFLINQSWSVTPSLIVITMELKIIQGRGLILKYWAFLLAKKLQQLFVELVLCIVWYFIQINFVFNKRIQYAKKRAYFRPCYRIGSNGKWNKLSDPARLEVFSLQIFGIVKK